MFKQTPSPSSMARLETTNDRFAHSIPYEQEDSPMNGNVAKFSTLPNLKAKGKKISKQVSGSSIVFKSFDLQIYNNVLGYVMFHNHFYFIDKINE